LTEQNKQLRETAMTIKEATENGPVVCMIGRNRTYAIGDTAYVFERQKPGLTLPPFAAGLPVSFIEGRFIRIQSNTIIRNWSQEVTVIATYVREV
jgi:hypothetical protein